MSLGRSRQSQVVFYKDIILHQWAGTALRLSHERFRRYRRSSQHYMLLFKRASAQCLNKAFSSRSVPTNPDVDFQFSDEFIRKHYRRLSRWESDLLKVQQQRTHDFFKSFSNTIEYLKKLEKLFSRSGQTVVPIGSCVNGLKKANSDLDIVLITHQKDNQRAGFEKKFVNVEAFRRAHMNRSISLYFATHDGTCVDLQFNNIGSIRSSLFVRTCVERSIVVPVVIHWLNSLFDVVKLKDSRNGLFSSYHLNMLALHFFQSAPVSFCSNIFTHWPQLHPSFSWHRAAKFLTAETVDAKHIYAHDVQPISAAETIVRMIDYYSQLDLQNTAVGIDGKTYRRQMEQEDESFIQIVDPYFEEDPRTPRCNVRNGPSLVGETFSALKSELECGAFRKLFLIR
nr:Protein C53A5.16 [Haemonchus contortus]